MLGIYCRISREKEEGKNISIPDQKKKGIAKAKELGLEYEIYVDEGISGTKPITERPAFSDLLEDITDDKITHLFAVDQSRIERSPETRIVVNTMLKKKGVRMFTEMEGEIDFDDPQQTMMGDIMSVFNRFFVDITTKKVKSALLHRAEEGKAHQGMQPYGYTKDKEGYLIVDEEEAEIIRKIYKMSLKGKGVKSIAKWLNDHDIPTRYNKIGKGTITTKNKYTGEKTVTEKKDIEWAGNTVRNFIINPIYKGERLYKGKTYEVPAIVSAEHWQEVNDNMKTNRKNQGNKPKYDYLLKGLLRCAACGRNYYGRTRSNRKDHFYMCSSKRLGKEKSCGNRSINIDAIENFIYLEIFNNPKRLEQIHNEYVNGSRESEKTDIKKEKEVAEGKVRNLKKRQERALELLLDGTLDKDVYKVQENKIKKELQELEKELTNLESKLEGIKIQKKSSYNIVDYIGEFTLQNTFEEKRELVQKFIKNIWVLYEEEEEQWQLPIEFTNGVELPIAIGKEHYEQLRNIPNIVHLKQEDENDGGDGNTGKSQNSTQNNTGKKGKTSLSSTTASLSEWFTVNNATDVTLSSVNQKLNDLLEY